MTGTDGHAPHVVVIGGLGGSGTRAVAEAFERIGYVHGPALNRSRDCLDFTYLFVRTDWMVPPLPSTGARLAIMRAIAETGDHAGAAPLDRLSDAVTDRTTPAGTHPFMIKEPNSHVFADEILTAWPDAAFLFVHRHPLDMAFSSNINQLKRWGAELGIDAASFGSIASAQLEVWIRAHGAQLARRTRFAGRTVELDYEAFVEAPAKTLGAVCAGLGVEVDARTLTAACRNVVPPLSRGRWQQEDLSVFTAAQLDYCARHGWLRARLDDVDAVEAGHGQDEADHDHADDRGDDRDSQGFGE